MLFATEGVTAGGLLDRLPFARYASSSNLLHHLCTKLAGSCFTRYLSERSAGAPQGDCALGQDAHVVTYTRAECHV